MSPFDDDTILGRLFTKFDQTDEKIELLRTNLSTTCISIAEIKTILLTHLDSEKAKSDRKEKVFYAIMAFVGTVVSLIELARSGIIG